MPYIPPHIQKLTPYQSARDLYQGDYTFMDANENCFGPLVGPEDLKNVDVSAYPDTDSTALRKVLAKYYDIDQDEMAIFNGSDAAIPELIITFSEPGDHVAGLDIGFGMYRSFTEMHGRKYLDLKTDENFELVINEDLEEAVEKARVIFLDTPNNPSGRMQSRETIEWLIKKTGESDTLLIIDEAYNQFTDDPEGSSFIQIVPKLSHVCVMRSFSKKWSMAGGRIGVVVGHKDLINTLIKVRIPYHVSQVAQALGIAAVGKRDEMERRCNLMKQYREELSQGLVERGLHVFASQGNFLLVKFPENSREIFDRLVEEYNIVLRYFGGGDTLAGKDSKLAHCVRITVGLPEHNKKLLAALGEIL